jgi:diguanylate cyclase (GGDEF)-like protein
MNEHALKRYVRKVITLVVVIAVLLFAGGFFILSSLSNLLTDSIDSQMESSAKEYRISLQKQVEGGFQILQTLTGFLDNEQIQDTERLAEGLYLSNTYNDFIRMGFFYPDGSGIRVMADMATRYDVQVEDLDPSAQSAILTAMEGEPTVSRIYQDPTLETGVFIYCVPVWAEDGSVAGVLAASTEISVFSEILDTGNVMGGNGTIHLIGSEGNFLVRTDHRVIQEDMENIFDKGYVNNAKADYLQEVMEKGESGFTSFRYGGTDYRIYLEPLGMNGWYLFCVNTAHNSSSPLYQMLFLVRIIFIVMLCLEVAFILYTVRLLYRNYHRLVKIAYYDPLTGAANMPHFMNSLQERLEKPGAFCLAAMNIRQFKFVNEIFGKEKGDQLLCLVKKVLEENLRESEFFCRSSADLFFLILEEKDRENVSRRLERIMAEIGEGFQEKDCNNYQLLLYCGAWIPENYAPGALTAEEVRTHTFFAMQTANGSYQNNIWFYDTELHKTELLENYVESHMHQALERKEFRLFFQPKYELSGGALHSAEALVRWIPEDGRTIYPDQFIGLFEENGFCTKLDMYMFEQVCVHIRSWMDRGLKPIPVSINQSKPVFYEEGYIKRLNAILQKYRVPASLITLEILEGLALENEEVLNRKIRELQNAGFRISMDDFGTGYSSLNTLGRIQIDELKLDRAFLMEASKGESRRQYMIMEEIIRLAKRLGIHTVAEGVETEEDERMIRAMGCDCGQGYYYSRPVSAEEFDRACMEDRK